MSGGPRSGGRHVGHVVCSVCRCHAACACAHRHRTAIAAAIRFASQNRPHEVYGPESDIRGRRPQPHGQRSCSSRICGGCGCVSCVWSSERVCAGLWIVRSRLHTRGHCALLCGVPPEPFRGAGTRFGGQCGPCARAGAGGRGCRRARRVAVPRAGRGVSHLSVARRRRDVGAGPGPSRPPPGGARENAGSRYDRIKAAYGLGRLVVRGPV